MKELQTYLQTYTPPEIEEAYFKVEKGFATSGEGQDAEWGGVL